MDGIGYHGGRSTQDAGSELKDREQDVDEAAQERNTIDLIFAIHNIVVIRQMLLIKKRTAPYSCFCVPYPQKNVFD